MLEMNLFSSQKKSGRSACNGIQAKCLHLFPLGQWSSASWSPYSIALDLDPLIHSLLDIVWVCVTLYCLYTPWMYRYWIWCIYKTYMYVENPTHYSYFFLLKRISRMEAASCDIPYSAMVSVFNTSYNHGNACGQPCCLCHSSTSSWGISVWITVPPDSIIWLLSDPLLLDIPSTTCLSMPQPKSSSSKSSQLNSVFLLWTFFWLHLPTE